MSAGGHKLVQRTVTLTPSQLDGLWAEAERRNVTFASVLRWAVTLGLRELTK